MSKLKLSWDTILGQRVVVCTKFIDHNVFSVVIKKGDYTAPDDPVWLEYTEYSFASKDDVVAEAFKKAKSLLEEELPNNLKKD